MILTEMLLAALSVVRLGPSQRPLHDSVFAPQVMAMPPAFDVRWLFETDRALDLRDGLEDVSGGWIMSLMKKPDEIAQ